MNKNQIEDEEDFKLPVNTRQQANENINEENRHTIPSKPDYESDMSDTTDTSENISNTENNNESSSTDNTNNRNKLNNKSISYRRCQYHKSNSCEKTME
jgi:hypothetical protein